MISYQMKTDTEDPKRPQINPTLSPKAIEALKKLAEEFNTKPTTVAGEIIELCYDAWAIQKRRYEAWVRQQLEKAANELPEDYNPADPPTEELRDRTRVVKLSATTPRRKKPQSNRKSG